MSKRRAGRFQVEPGSRITGVMRMKSRESLVRLKEFQVNEKRRQLQQLQMMMSEFERMTKDLESQIVVEEKKSGISDPNHFAYPTFAKAARQRADNLQVSIKELKMQEESLEMALEEMQAEYARATALEERDTSARARA
ncbi:chaperonin cofactor prefoldin [Rhizobium sp. BK619]|uniref:Chaperonin cofactor prefoldin n=9 Tax=Rhizobium TaxID=379 RepID=A0A7W9ZZW4_RHILE|nr:chaperonin cofactor prefoldin [Rhizobium sp. BK456]MBB3648097.1 chaperonin cofactor prefoldin [Rhizobium sp. BK619]MBB5666796.1 chaperonin cofactor prefoldin [Rhizobium leguminosarum]MBB6224674.1 chaperonin cofactor prefoldin [Rhizobium leguminosarum]